MLLDGQVGPGLWFDAYLRFFLGAETFDEAVLVGLADRNLRGQIRDAERAVGTLGKAITELESTPGAFGVRGFITDKVGKATRVLDGLFGTDASGALSQAVSGADPEKVAQARTNAKFLAAQMLSAITGEESGRYTEAEQLITAQTLRTLEATESPETIKGALGTALQIQLISEDRAARELGQEPTLPVDTAEGINKIRDDLSKQGIPDPMIKSLILERRRQLGLAGQ